MRNIGLFATRNVSISKKQNTFLCWWFFKFSIFFLIICNAEFLISFSSFPNRVDGERYDDSVDRWCLGILCYEFLVGRPPFESARQETTYEKIRALDIVYPSHVSIGAKDLVSGVIISLICWELDFSIRLVFSFPFTFSIFFSSSSY